jgi:diguanylate cyclase (GGDEF)-like protein
MASGDTGPTVTADRGRRRAVEDSQPRSDDHDPGRQPDFWILLLRARMAASLLLPLALVAFPAFGPNRYVLGVVAGLAGLWANVTLLERSQAGKPVRGRVAAADIGSVLVILLYVPQAYPAGVVLLVSISSLYLFWFGGQRAVVLLAPTSVALFAIGVWQQPAMWVPTWLAWVTTAVLGALPLSRLAALSIATRNRYDDMVNGIDAALWEASGSTHDADYTSDRFDDLFGFGADELRSFRRLLQQVVPEDRRRVLESRQRAASGHDVEIDYRLTDAGGRRRHVHERITVSAGSDGSFHRRGIVVDDTARWEAERSVRSYAHFVENVPIALAILRLDEVADPTSLRVVEGNPTAAALVGLDPGEVQDRHLRDLLPLSEGFAESLADVAIHDQILEQPYVRIDTLGAVFALRAVPLQDRCIGLMLEDVTANANRSKSLQHQATHDHLTGLPNRAMFHDRLARAFGRATGDGRRTALLMIDLNHFKEVNDSLGHEVGDLLLVELAKRLARDLRYCDTIARLGGDEFAILLTDTADHTAAQGAARRILELCGEPFEIEGFKLQVGASIGIAWAPEHASDPRTLLRHADRAMYRAKAGGGGVVEHSPLHDSEGATRITLLEDLRSAVGTDELVLHYQPKVDLRTGRTVGVEALVRWRHPHRGLLRPADFLELAEVSGEIEALTRAVTERATSDLAAIDPDATLELDINLSARALRDPALPEWLTSVLATTGIGPERLHLEISERDLLEDPERSVESLRRLRRIGVRLAVDDFGTGGSSVVHLRELPVDEVKIDRKFIADLDGDTTVVRSVIGLCHDLGLNVVAEGVESAGALESLREFGCDVAQGYHLARPMPLADLIEHLAAARTEPLLDGPGPHDPDAALQAS